MRRSLIVGGLTFLTSITLGTSAAHATMCAGDPLSDPVAVCANADPHVYDPQPGQPGTGISSAESVTLFVYGDAYPACVSRVELAINVPSGPEGGAYAPLTYTCY
jgi:hypothetical protein